MAAMMGVTIGFARLSSDSEILALKASGISMYQIIPPVLIVTFLIALVTSYCSIKLIPLSEIAMKQMTYQLLKERVNKGIKAHSFTEALGDVVVYVDEIDKSTGGWTDVWVSDMRGVENPIVTMASTGSMKSNVQDMTVSIILENGSLHRPSTVNAQIVEFDKYQINVPLRPPDSKATRVKRRNVLSMGELLEEARTIEDDPETKRKFFIEFHKRLVLPGGCLLISIIGLPLGLQARPGKKAIGIQAGLGIFILYYVLYTFGKNMAEENVLPVILAMWAPNCLFFFLALFWIYRITNEKSLIPQSVTSFFFKITSGTSVTLKRLVKNTAQQINRSKKDLQKEEDTLLNRKKLLRGNAKTREFHFPECKYYNSNDCTLEFKNADVALDSGFKPCQSCKKILIRQKSK